MNHQNPHFDFAALPDAECQRLLTDHQIALTLDEARTIQTLLNRPPTLAECILWGIQGSEHCSYKSSRIHLKTLTTDGPNVILGAKEDAGVVHIATDENGEEYGIVISHESHNHPSQIVPFEGAATGIGGNVRDVGCMGATVIANADSLRFGNPKLHKTQWIQDGVVAGIASYSNALGVPNLYGDVQYHDGYNDNCLVTAVSLGVIKVSDIIHSYAPENAKGYQLILVGKPTDQSGFGGASFASVDLEEEKKDQNRGAVQEPNAFLGRVLLKAHYALFEKLKAANALDKVGFKDLGAGGIACASVELAETAGYGAHVQLDDVHTSFDDLNPAVILCAETQERYMWVCPPELTPMILEHYNKLYSLPNVSVGAQATVVGHITTDGRYQVKYQGETLIDAMARDITQGIVYDRPQKPLQRQHPIEPLPQASITEWWQQLLAHDNIRSQKPIYEQYDKQVQGRAVLERGLADAGVLAPFDAQHFPNAIQKVGASLTTTANPRFGQKQPRWAAIHAVSQAMFNTAAVGATAEAITDCLCFGNPEIPSQMADFVAAVEGIKSACENLTLSRFPDVATPIVAGNVSLYNETQNGAIPASPMIACLGRLDDIQHMITPAFKAANEHIIYLGNLPTALGGSVLETILAVELGPIPEPDLKQNQAILQVMHQLNSSGAITAAKSIGAGGLLIALTHMNQQSDYGFKINLPKAQLAAHCFSEQPGIIITLPTQHYNKFMTLCEQVNLNAIALGKTQEGTCQVNQYRLLLAQ